MVATLPFCQYWLAADEDSEVIVRFRHVRCATGLGNNASIPRRD
jgi:hypothetical protein